MSSTFAKVHSAQTFLLESYIVDCEVDLSLGLHAFTIVGLPDKAVEEARDRISAAIKHSGFESPKSKNQKVVISLAPAHLKKEGPSFDVPMALSYLLASGEMHFDPQQKLFIGELSLNGDIRGVHGVLPLVQKALQKGFKEVYVPKENAEEAALIRGITIYGVENLKTLVEHLHTPTKGETGVAHKKILPQKETVITPSTHPHTTDIADIKGQESAKRGLLIAAAGGHNIALFGPAGTGKTMLARAMQGILPTLSYEEILEVTSIYSVAGLLKEPYITTTPYRAPHHTASYVSLVGGGAFPKPGEVTLAHRGVLFMDEFPEFERRVIDALRQPLEDRVVSINRQRGSGVFPANFILIVAFNPCPCGNYGSQKPCRCNPGDIIRYQKKISGPIADRIDMWIEVPLLAYDTLTQKQHTDDSATYTKKIIAAKERAGKRYSTLGKTRSADLSAKELEMYVPLHETVRKLLIRSSEKLMLSARSYHKVIKVARTIADLEESKNITEAHLLEALQYRQKIH